MMKSHYAKSYLHRGGVLIIFVLVLVLGSAATLFSMLDGRDIRIERDKRVAATLAAAKTGLIGFSIKAASGGTRPGDLIIPDALTEGPPNYDGTADGGCLDKTKAATNGLPLINSDINMRCLGRLPWKDLGLSINSPSENDAGGIMPWYAVSGNLVDPTCLSVLNPNILNLINNSSLATLDCSGVTLPYPWLTVRDSSGNIVSNRVAAVIIIPGSVRGAQSRLSSPLGAANQYLDVLVVPAGCSAPCVPGTYSNADMDNDFIMASESEPIASASNFNDQLVYITIEELMSVVEKRAAQEASYRLRDYYLNSSGVPANRFYPYAATLGSSDNACVESNLKGLLPLFSPFSSCISSSNCSSSFAKTPSIKFIHTCSGNYTAKTGACNFSGKTCTCSGQGSCTRNPTSMNSSCTGSTRLRRFSCDANGNCKSNIAGQYTFTYIPPVPDKTVVTGSCSQGVSVVTCNGSGSFSITNCSHPNKVLTGLQSWFTDNLWQDFMYYDISNDCNYASPGCALGNLKVGTKANNHALIVSSGAKLNSQTRPSPLVEDYLDSAENTDGNNVFDAIGTPRSNTYNDQMFIVAP